MTEETTTGPSRNEYVCPASLRIGVIQSYRCEYQKTEGVIASRPVVGTDRWAHNFRQLLTDLGHENNKVYYFSPEDGAEARRMAIEKVNNGEIRAPRRNWDKNFGPQGGLPLSELKEKYPELYSPKKSQKAEAEIVAEEKMEHEEEGELEVELVPDYLDEEYMEEVLD